MDYPPTYSLSMLLLLFHNLSSLIASSTTVSGKGLCRATGSATWAHLMAPCGFPTIQVQYRPIVHLPSCSRKAGGFSCLCSLLPQSGKLVHLGYNGWLSHQYVVQERLWGVGLQHGFPLALTTTFWEPVAHFNEENICRQKLWKPLFKKKKLLHPPRSLYLRPIDRSL